MIKKNKIKSFKVTAIILTFNEELHIKRCLKSLRKITNDIIVIDSYSSDKTVKIAKKYKAKVFQNKFINQAKQMNWALKNTYLKNRWILRLDADEILASNFNSNIMETIENNKNISGIIVQRKIKFLNKIINYGLTSPHETLRIWKNKKGKYQNVSMDEQVIVNGEVILSKATIIDHNLNNILWWIFKHNKYAIRETESYFRDKKKFSNKMKISKDVTKLKQNKKYRIYYRFPIFIRAFLLFLYSYIFRLGFLTGVRGFIFYFLQTFCYRFLVDFYIFINFIIKIIKK